MATGFERVGESYVATLSDDERDVVVSLFEQTAQLLESAAPATAAPAQASSDPFEDLMRSAGWEPGVDPASSAASEAGDPSSAEPPADAALDDPALRRLLPDAHRGDPSLAEQFRRLSGDNIRQRKLTTLTAAVTALSGGESGHVSLTSDEAQAVLVALTDVRLVLAERLDIRTDDDAEHLDAQLAALAESDERAQAMLLYDFLTWLQETLASALLG